LNFLVQRAQLAKPGQHVENLATHAKPESIHACTTYYFCLGQGTMILANIMRPLAGFYTLEVHFICRSSTISLRTKECVCVEEGFTQLSEVPSCETPSLHHRGWVGRIQEKATAGLPSYSHLLYMCNSALLRVATSNTRH
jgi:hypothetical protein